MYQGLQAFIGEFESRHPCQQKSTIIGWCFFACYGFHFSEIRTPLGEAEHNRMFAKQTEGGAFESRHPCQQKSTIIGWCFFACYRFHFSEIRTPLGEAEHNRVTIPNKKEILPPKSVDILFCKGIF